MLSQAHYPGACRAFPRPARVARLLGVCGGFPPSPLVTLPPAKDTPILGAPGRVWRASSGEEPRDGAPAGPRRRCSAGGQYPSTPLRHQRCLRGSASGPVRSEPRLTQPRLIGPPGGRCWRGPAQGEPRLSSGRTAPGEREERLLPGGFPSVDEGGRASRAPPPPSAGGPKLGHQHNFPKPSNGHDLRASRNFAGYAPACAAPPHRWSIGEAAKNLAATSVWVRVA